MTKEELMKPRFRVIADCPQSIFPLGIIIATDIHGNWVQSYNGLQKEADVYTPHLPHNFTPDKYPHLFRKLAWWEERKKEDMPKYIKAKSDGRVADVEKWNMSKDKNRPEDTYASVRGYCWFVQGNAPATEEEFKNQK